MQKLLLLTVTATSFSSTGTATRKQLPIMTVCLGGLAKKYNKYHEEALPKAMTPHTLRHTFCTNMANAGMNPKALQYIMGHSNITMTLNYYAHATFDSAKAEMLRIAA